MFAKLTACGRLSRDPETRDNGPCRFSIACSRTYKNKAGEKVEETEWVNVVAWDKLGELCQRFLTKGRVVLIEARPSTREYEDKEGVKRKATEWIAESVTFLPDGKGKSGGGSSEDGASASAGSASDDHDEIPF